MLKKKIVIIGAASIGSTELNASIDQEQKDGTDIIILDTVPPKKEPTIAELSQELLDHSQSIVYELSTIIRDDYTHYDLVKQKRRPHPGWRPATDLIQLSNRRKFSRPPHKKKSRKKRR